ncbi:MAG: glycosyltransferase family 4 protein [Saprospiraceae bacterium]|nr:glycosyltransferase family 4 protein [Pyrinomonadaceae bacterium]
MRLLQISSAKVFGGGERHFVDLCRGLQARGHSVFAALRPTNEWQSRLDFLPAENILHVSIRNSFGILSANKMAGFIRDNQIEIVHAHVARDYIPASIACVLTKNAKFVLTRHVLFPLKPFNRFALKNLSKAIAVSAGVETALQKVFPRPRIEVIPNGIDIENWSNADHGKLREEFRFLHSIPFDAPLVGTVGELIPLKGQRDFVLAANEIVKSFPDAHFVVVGKDNTIDKKFRRELKRLVKVFRLDERFLWLDWVDDTAELLAALDIFVSASHSESFGLAILEAMATGTAVVATQTEGARELLVEKELLVPIKDPVKLADMICSYLKDPEKRQGSVVKAQALASEKFSLVRMIDQTEALYQDVLQQ